VVSERLTPEQAIRKVLAVAAAVPQLSVVGIAGPGDPLANPEATLATLAGVRKAAPDLTLCLSTNGLALPDHVERLAELGVGHVTVTVNFLDPEVGAAIHPWAVWKGRRVRGTDGARLLSERQWEGLTRLAERGVLCKVNSVVIPGVNDAHLPEVARRARELGVFLHNVMPLISAPEHGTHYGLTGQRGPTAEELQAVQRACEVDGRLMRHCRQCRADAVGLLGEDRGAEFSLSRLPQGPVPDGRAARAAHRAAVAAVRERQRSAARIARARLASVDAALTARVAVATMGGGLVNQHFGHAREFLVFEVTRAGARLLASRPVARSCTGGDGDDAALEGALRALADCQAVLVAKVGRCPKDHLSRAGVEPVEALAHRPIEAAALAWFEGWAAEVAKGLRPLPARRAAPMPLVPAGDEDAAVA
jgi:nitrogen fixation protein NifB